MEYGIIQNMFHGEVGLDGVFDHPSQFNEDRSKAALFVKKQFAVARGSLILDQPFFGYLLGQYEIVTVKNGIMTYAADANHIYVNTDYFTEILQGSSTWKGKFKGILIHLIIHIIFRHHKRQKSRDKKIWAMAVDIVVFSHLHAFLQSWVMPSDWKIPSLEQIPENLRGHSADVTYKLILEEIEENVPDDERGRRADNTEEDINSHPNLEDYMINKINEMEENMGLKANECDIEEILLEVNENSQEEELEEQYFEGMLRTAYERQKGFGSLPQGLDRLLQDRLNPRIDWKTTLSRYLQNVIAHDLAWTRPNKRLLGQGYFIPGPVKENTTVLLAVDTSGSIDDDILSLFLAEAQSILETITNVKLIVVDCDAEVQQIKMYELGESIDRHIFVGHGGTDFRPVFDLIPEYHPDVLLYITDGKGVFPLVAPDVPVIWILTQDVLLPFGNRVMLRL